MTQFQREIHNQSSVNGRYIALFMENFAGGGVERVTLNLAGVLASRGHKVELLVANSAGPNATCVPDAVTVLDFKVNKVKHCLRPLMQYLMKNKPDVLISAEGHTNITAIASKMLARSHTKVIVTVHNNVNQLSAGSTPRAHRVRNTLYRAMYPLADAIVAVSDATADYLADATGLKRSSISVIYNPTITDEILRKANEDPKHHWFPATEVPVVMGMGRLSPVKDFGSLIRAFRLVRNDRLAKLLILGEGPEREALETLICDLKLCDDVEMPGFLENPYPLLRSSSCFVLSSLHEALPGALIEALAFGTPVVSTRCPGGVQEILSDDSFGKLVELGDIEGMATAILDTLDLKTPIVPPRSWSRFTDIASAKNYENIIGEMFSPPKMVQTNG